MPPPTLRSPQANPTMRNGPVAPRIVGGGGALSTKAVRFWLFASIALTGWDPARGADLPGKGLDGAAFTVRLVRPQEQGERIIAL